MLFDLGADFRPEAAGVAEDARMSRECVSVPSLINSVTDTTPMSVGLRRRDAMI
jgi:hypothetical protein